MDGALPSNSQLTREALLDLTGAVGRLALAVAKLQTAMSETRLAITAASGGDLATAEEALGNAGTSVDESSRESDAVMDELVAILRRMADPHG